MSGQRDARPLARGIVPWSGCMSTGKRGYASRADAKKAMRRGQLQADGMHPYICPGCGSFHLGHHDGLTRQEHRAYHEGHKADDDLVDIEHVVAEIRPRNAAKLRAILTRGVAEGRISGESILGITVIRAHEIPRLKRAAWDTAQDSRLKGMK